MGIDYDTSQKMQIFDATERMLDKTSFDKITVIGICRETGISRPTFYHYFKDKFDIAQWFWDETAYCYLNECGRSLGWYESNLFVFREALQHKAFHAAVNSSDTDPNSCIKHGYRRRSSCLESVIREFNPILLTDDIRFQIDFFVDAESRAVAAWERSDMTNSPEQLARRIESCVPKELHDTVLESHKQWQASNRNRTTSENLSNAPRI